jgi:isocitrate dehydrogenase
MALGRTSGVLPKLVFDAAVEKAYGAKKQLMEGSAGRVKKSLQSHQQLAGPTKPLDASVNTRGHQQSAGTTPVGGGIRLPNAPGVRTCTPVRAPVRYYDGALLAQEAPGADQHHGLPREHRG